MTVAGMWRTGAVSCVLVTMGGCGLLPTDPLETLVFCDGYRPDAARTGPPGWPGWEDVSVIAHRGFACCYPENTLEAIDAAIEAGADAVELDVRLTRDGVPILMHDDSIGRTTDHSGKVEQLTFTALDGVDACPTSSAPCVVPTLGRALEIARNRTRVVLDVKGVGTCDAFRAVRSVIDERGMAGRVAIISGNPNTLSIARSYFPDLPIGLYLGQWPTPSEEADEALDISAYLGTAELLLRVEAAMENDRAFRLAVDRGVPVTPWVVRSPQEIEPLLSTPGVARVLSDVPPG